MHNVVWDCAEILPDVSAIILIEEYSALLHLGEIFIRKQGLHESRVHSWFVKIRNCTTGLAANRE